MNSGQLQKYKDFKIFSIFFELYLNTLLFHFFPNYLINKIKLFLTFSLFSFFTIVQKKISIKFLKKCDYIDYDLTINRYNIYYRFEKKNLLNFSNFIKKIRQNRKIRKTARGHCIDILSYHARIPMVLIALINFGSNVCSTYDEKD